VQYPGVERLNQTHDRSEQAHQVLDVATPLRAGSAGDFMSHFELASSELRNGRGAFAVLGETGFLDTRGRERVGAALQSLWPGQCCSNPTNC
jgi:hypothetical protein